MTGIKRYVVLIGNAGTGKSALVEKVTGMNGISSGASIRVTKSSNVYEAADGSLMICDTPGIHSFDDSFRSNLEIARALNFFPVDLVLITVKADIRIEPVVKYFRKYMECFLPENFPKKLIGFCITHMDKVSWGENEMSVLKNESGIENVILSCPEKKSTTLTKEIRDLCKKQPVTISVDNDLFSKLFEIKNDKIKVLRETLKEVSTFTKIKQYFYNKDKRYTENEQKDLIFEFQAWILDENPESRNPLYRENNFSFNGDPGKEHEYSLISNVMYQMHQILHNVKIGAMNYHVNVETDFRKCSYCGEIWDKIESCKDDTENSRI